ncbi:MAG: phosphoribosylformylglycinamidine synthase II, partial [Sphingomonadales bacterium]|nr:phosphoribosylformylglycinamidine synthase II [Sphingomonadales bacterium]
NRALIKGAADLSDGGLALAAFEMAEAAGVGVTLDADDIPTLFGEDQARYLVACSFDQAEALMVAARKAEVPLATVGRFGGDTVSFGSESATLAELSSLYKSAFKAAVDA